ncbi:hypothetical protein DICPUDRAFT_150312 [Dictyostelium purpureum]|uniref:Uncharacterized protein n=1 Tax=Dictyostelium purpureum TaxID=5786 RepID=F0ZG05_DICPU|nr:uncharacterized protein DICPUDRAFT_150312 [Dictyostelium purpureum]EGC37131.1 hypothetical protein DICPUDRAFT_150312 [Dictyostelium purpureum]|eukprot:XP_003286334.1 hypothetical protein DICPUDRAFT_150312 [Dictyostelium purpureum]
MEAKVISTLRIYALLDTPFSNLKPSNQVKHLTTVARFSRNYYKPELLKIQSIKKFGNQNI